MGREKERAERGKGRQRRVNDKIKVGAEKK